MKYCLFIPAIAIIFFLYSCDGANSKLKVDLSDVEEPDIEIERYGKDLFSVDPGNLKKELQALSGKYSFFLGGNLDDTLSLLQIKSYITDPYLVEIFDTCMKKYPDLEKVNKKLTKAFHYYKYYFPGKKIPSIYSYISGLDFEHPVRFIDTVMIIALDMYLGKEAKFYKQIGLPEYKTNFFDEEYISPDCMKEIATEIVAFDLSNKSLLEQMIYHGKVLYFLDAMFPDMADDKKIKYTTGQLEWCRKNETNIWSLFIDQELLYSTDMTAINKFTNDGPFTTGLSKESPARLGHWIGWQIVRAYMKTNETSLNDLMLQHDAQLILSKSSYKPGR